MNSEFQILRWGIPGWVCLLTFTLFTLSTHNFDLKSFGTALGGTDKLTGIAALFVALGVPLGFILYQLYFWFKWDFKKDNSEIAAEGLDELQRRLQGNGHDKWRVIEDYFDELMSIKAYQKQLSYDDLKRRYDHYSNRTSRIHGLGASLLALVFGTVGFFAININCGTQWNSKTVALIFLVIFVGFSIYKNYSSLNRNVYRQLNSIMKDILRAEDKTCDCDK